MGFLLTDDQFLHILWTVAWFQRGGSRSVGLTAQESCRLTENLQGCHDGSFYLLEEGAGLRCFLAGIVGTYSLSGTAKRQGAKGPSYLGRCDKGGNHMFSKTDFWIGLAVGAVAGIFGYRFMQERTQQLAALEAGQAELSLAELQRQKEELEDLIAAQSAAEK